jgi:hypothetical protein
MVHRGNSFMLSGELKRRLLDPKPLEEGFLKEAYLCTIQGPPSAALVTLFPLIQWRNIGRLSVEERAKVLDKMIEMTEEKLDVSDQVMLLQCIAKIITKNFDEKLMRHVFVESDSCYPSVRGAAILSLEYAAQMKVAGAFDKLKKMTLDSDLENQKFASKSIKRVSDVLCIAPFGS